MSPAKVLLAVCSILVVPEVALAQFFAPQAAPLAVRDVSLRRIEKAVQCEIGNFAQYVSRQRLTPNRLNAAYVITEKTTDTAGMGLIVNFFVVNFGNTTKFDLVGDNVFTFDPINIHTANRRACSKRKDALVLLQLRECLRRAAEVYDHSAMKCGSQVNVKTDISGGAKVPIYYVTFGPNVAWGTEYSRGIQVVAPPPTR